MIFAKLLFYLKSNIRCCYSLTFGSSLVMRWGKRKVPGGKSSYSAYHLTPDCTGAHFQPAHSFSRTRPVVLLPLYFQKHKTSKENTISTQLILLWLTLLMFLPEPSKTMPVASYNDTPFLLSLSLFFFWSQRFFSSNSLIFKTL